MVYLVGRYYVFNQESLEELKTIVSNTVAAADLIHANHYPIKLGFKITINEEKIGMNATKEAQQILQKLPPKIWLLYNSVNQGAGTSYRQILFNPTFSREEEGIVVGADFDQFIIDDAEGLESILSLVENVKSKNSLYGIGSRDVPIKLAEHERNNRLRIIHELFHSLTIGKDLVVAEKVEDVTPSYAAFVESSSGLYVMNQRHPAYPELLKKVSSAVQQANMRGFAADYYVAIAASQLAPIGTRYVKAKENKFYQMKSEEDEYSEVLNLISSQTRELLKTDIGAKLYSTLVDPRTSRRIAKFYREEEVLEVQLLMLDAVS